MEKCQEFNCCGYFRKGHEQTCMNCDTAKCIIEGLTERSPNNFADFLGYAFGIFSYDEVVALRDGLQLNIDLKYIEAAFPNQDLCYEISILCEDLRYTLQNYKLQECVVKLQSMKKCWDICVLHEPMVLELLKVGYFSEYRSNFVRFCKVCLQITDDEVHEICRNTRKRKKNIE